LKEKNSKMIPFYLVFRGALLLNLAYYAFRLNEHYQKRIRGDRLTEKVNAQEQDEVGKTKQWQALIRKYLCVYLLASFSDWLQGPYVYALYAEYGYSHHETALLFVVGFASSMIFGSFIGGMADWGGRRLFAVIFALVYASSCVAKRKFL
jgi:Na+/melibiose symporter-like transporter